MTTITIVIPSDSRLFPDDVVKLGRSEKPNDEDVCPNGDLGVLLVWVHLGALVKSGWLQVIEGSLPQ